MIENEKRRRTVTGMIRKIERKTKIVRRMIESPEIRTRTEVIERNERIRRDLKIKAVTEIGTGIEKNLVKMV